MIEPGAWTAPVDLKDAFFTIPIHSDYRKFFKFIRKRIPYEFSSKPDGYSAAKSHSQVLQDETFEEFLQNTTETVQLLHSPGLTIHSEKSGKAYKKNNIFKI